MARPLRIEYPGAIYHVTSRGNAGQAIFLEDEDRSLWLSILDQVVRQTGWLCHAYCLMGNHYHLMIETPDGGLSRGMRQLNGLYTQRFPRRPWQPASSTRCAASTGWSTTSPPNPPAPSSGNERGKPGSAREARVKARVRS